ncbi:MAG: GTPase [bacterium]
MPANLTPQYLEAEERYRRATTDPEKLEALEDMLSFIPKHKGTEKMQADIKRRISKLKKESSKRGPKSRAGSLYHIERSGVAQLIVLGAPNVGKSSILASVTSANPEVADYPFTTRRPQPGMMDYEDIQIQLVDTPPIAPGFVEKWLTEIVRRADGALLVVDLSSDDLLDQIDTVCGLLEEHRIRLVGGGAESPAEEGVSYKRTLVVGNKLDLGPARDNYEILRELYAGGFPVIAVSAKGGDHLDEMRKAIYDMLGIIRVYTKTPGKEADMTDPVVLKRGSTVVDVALSIHKDFARNLKFAKIWGEKTFDGQEVPRDYIVNDKDIVELHI